MLVYWLSSWLILLAFWFVSVHMVLTLIEFYFGVMVATVLVPFGMPSVTALFGEFAIGWVTPGRAASIAGRGVSLARHAGTVLAAAAGPGRGILVASQAIRGVSSLLR